MMKQPAVTVTIKAIPEPSEQLNASTERVYRKMVIEGRLRKRFRGSNGIVDLDINF
jgi:hypothetical protein